MCDEFWGENHRTFGVQVPGVLNPRSLRAHGGPTFHLGPVAWGDLHGSAGSLSWDLSGWRAVAIDPQKSRATLSTSCVVIYLNLTHQTSFELVCPELWHLLAFFPVRWWTSLLEFTSSKLSTWWVLSPNKIPKKFVGENYTEPRNKLLTEQWNPWQNQETNGSLVVEPILDVAPCLPGFLTHFWACTSCGSSCASLLGFLVLIHLMHTLSLCSAPPFC